MPSWCRVIADAGDKAARRFLEFFAATIRNKNTRMAYYRAAERFFAWCDHHRIGEIADIEPLHVAGYIEAMGKDFEKPTVKQHLAAIRMLFDWLVTGQVVATNPAHSVRGPKHVVKTGKTTVLTDEQARELLDSIDTSTVVGLRDRAADLGDDPRLCPHRRDRRHARRGLLSQGQALVGPSA
jgi:site-specific recombinase XerD